MADAQILQTLREALSRCVDVSFVPEGESIKIEGEHLLVPETLRLSLVIGRSPEEIDVELSLLLSGDSERLWESYPIIDEIETRHDGAQSQSYDLEQQQLELRRRLRFNSFFLNSYPKSHFGWRWRSIAFGLLQWSEEPLASPIAATEGCESLNDFELELSFLVAHLHRRALNSGALSHLSRLIALWPLEQSFNCACQIATLFPSSSHAFVLVCECLEFALSTQPEKVGREMLTRVMNMLDFWNRSGSECYSGNKKMLEEVNHTIEDLPALE